MFTILNQSEENKNAGPHSFPIPMNVNMKTSLSTVRMMTVLGVNSWYAPPAYRPIVSNTLKVKIMIKAYQAPRVLLFSIPERKSRDVVKIHPGNTTKVMTKHANTYRARLAIFL